MKRKLLKQTKFDPVTMEVTYKIIFVNESIVQDFVESNGRTFAVDFYESNRQENDLRDGTRKRWFHLLGRILSYQKADMTLDEFSENMKSVYFGYSEKQNRKGESIILPPSLTIIPDDKVKKANDKMIEFYSRLGVNFKDIV